MGKRGSRSFERHLFLSCVVYNLASRRGRADYSGSSARVVYDLALFDLASRRGRADYSGSSARVVYDLALFGLAF